MDSPSRVLHIELNILFDFCVIILLSLTIHNSKTLNQNLRYLKQKVPREMNNIKIIVVFCKRYVFSRKYVINVGLKVAKLKIY